VILALALLAAFQSPGLVHVVDGTAGPYFTIQDAVDAAADGETILVRAGSYESFVVNDEDLAIVGDSGANVEVRGAIRVSDLAAPKQVVLQNFVARGRNSAIPLEAHGLHLQNCTGSVRAQDCIFEGWSPAPCGTQLWDGGHGAWTQNCGDVAFTTCTLRGGGTTQNTIEQHGNVGHGLRSENSALALHSSESIGGPSTACCNALMGGHGIFVTDSFLQVENSIVRGRDGSNSGLCACSYGGSGGSGLVLWGESQAWLGSNQVIAGSSGGGLGGLGCASRDMGGNPGAPILQIGAAWYTYMFNAPLRTLEIPSPVRAGSTMAVRIQGGLGNRIRLFMSESTVFESHPAWNGMLLTELRPNSRWFDVGVLTTQTMTFTLPVPPIPAGRQSVVLHMQALQKTPPGNWVLGNAATVVVLDPNL